MIEILENAAERLTMRKAICEACDSYIPETIVEGQTIDAIDGQTKVSVTLKSASCSLAESNILSLIDSKYAICPKGKW